MVIEVVRLEKLSKRQGRAFNTISRALATLGTTFGGERVSNDF